LYCRNKNDLYFDGQNPFMSKRPNQNIMELRQLTGLSQEYAAGLLDVSRTVIAMYESAGRSLATYALLYHTYLVMEMKKTENEQLATLPSVTDAAKAKWKRELEYTVLRCRHEADQLQCTIDDFNLKEDQHLGRLRMVPCAEKVIASLAEQSKTTGYNPINQNHLKWLELQRQENSRDRFREEAWLEHKFNQLRYTMLLKEAEEAERLAGEMEKA
jgi:transcriptional regulator with XRE-family HTH domain